MHQFRQSCRSVSIVLFTGTIVLSAAGCSKGSSTNTTVTLTPAEAVLGQANFTSGIANQGGATDTATLSQPFGGGATDGTHFYLPDYGNNRILGYTGIPTATGTPPNFVLGQPDFTSALPNDDVGIASLGLAHPESVWVDKTSGLFVVADTGNNRVLVWTTPPTSDTPPALVLGQTTLTGNKPGLSASALATPTGAAIANDDLIVVDSGNNRVLIWSGIKELVAGGSADDGTAANLVLGQPNFTSGTAGITIPPASGGTQQGEFSAPTGVWSDGFSFFISDTGNNRVLYWTSVPTTDEAQPNFVIGQSSLTFNTTTISAATMNAPTGLYSDGNRLFVADTGNNRVLIFSAFPINNGAPAYALLGQQDFTHNTANDDNGDATSPQTGVQLPNPTQRTLSQPTGVVYVGSTLYVTDRGNNRVLLFDNSQLNNTGVNTTNG